MNAYNDVWHAGLFLFGLHLLVVGYLAFRSGYVPKLIAVLVAIDGLSYVVDTFGTVLPPGHWTDTATHTFIGELLLGMWLVIRDRRLTLNAPGASRLGVRNTELVRSIGATHVVDSASEDFADGPGRYDVILDNGGNRTIRDLRRATTPPGS